MERVEEGGLVVRGRVEIDMRQPFRSVKEAVLLFGEKVLAGEVYANKLKEIENKQKNGKYTSKTGAADHHVEPTKQKSAEKAKEESNNLMVQCLNSLRQELEQTKMELRQLKSRESHIETYKQLVIEPEIEELEQTKMELRQLKSRESHIETYKQLVIEPEIEELKFIENSSTTNVKAEIKKQTEEENDLEFEKKRSVKFASPPLLTRVIINKDDSDKVGEQTPSPKKKPKKKPLVSLMGGLFLKKERK